MAKNLAAGAKAKEAEEHSQNSSFEHISMGSFEDRPSTVKNTKGLKKIQFDEIMKGIHHAEPDAAQKRAATIVQEEDAVDGEADSCAAVAQASHFQAAANKKQLASKTFFAPSKAPAASKKIPMTTKHQAMVTTISFNTTAKEDEFGEGAPQRSSLVPESKQKSLMKKKLLQQTRTGVQSPRITTQTAGEKGKESATGGKSPVTQRKPALNTGLYKRSQQAIKTSSQLNTLSQSILKDPLTTKNKSGVAAHEVKG